MAGVLAELKKLTAFAKSFFAALGLLVLALPLLADLSSVLPYSPTPEGTVKVLSVIVGLIAVGRPYLATLAGHRQLRSMGVLWLFASIGLILLYLLLVPEPGRQPTVRENWILLCTYLAIYFALASGLIELALYAYALQHQGHLPNRVAEPFWKSFRHRFRQWRQDRAERREREREREKREERRRQIEKEAEEDRHRRQAERRTGRLFRYALLCGGVLVLSLIGLVAFRLYGW